MLSADLGLSWAALPYALLAAVMLGVNLWLFLLFIPRRGGSPPTFSRALMITYFVAASPLFWLAAYEVVVAPSLANWEYVFLGMGVMMAAPAVWMIGAVFPSGAEPIQRTNPVWPAVLAAAIVVNELLMALVFVAALGGPGASVIRPGTDPIVALSAAVNSTWFFWSMLVNMVVFLFWVPIGRAERFALLALASSAGVAPLVTAAPWLGAIGMAATMTAAYIVLFETLATHSTVSPRLMWTTLGVAAAFCGMAVAQLAFLWSPASTDAGVAFATFSIAMMAAELYLVARGSLVAEPGPAETPQVPWIQKPVALTTFLALAFVSEWCMAAGFVVLTSGTAALPMPGVHGEGFGLAAAALQGVASVVVDVGLVTASPFFLGLMGLEMGALVVSRLRVTASREQRVRLSLALGVYGVYSVLGPGLWGPWSRYPGAWPNLGAFGGVDRQLLPAMLGSYAVFALLAVGFGRRSYCSVLCPSAVMYGGSFSQQLIPTIRERPAPRHQVLGSRWRRIPLSLGAASWVSFGAVFALSGWNALRGGSLTIGGVDIATAYSIAVWNVVWYGFFIAIPYAGMSPCRTWGWCTTGTFVGAIGRLGFYRKEALDRDTCRSCRTHDCGKACEVGLVDMPMQLALTGRFRSVKCVGAGDCEAACPYGNLVTRDVRDSVRRWVGLPDRFRDRAPGGARGSAPRDVPIVAASAPQSSSQA